MSYVYDIVLNFNNDYYEFYEWKNIDSIYHIKRINLVMVDSKTYNDIYDNVVVFNKEFLLSIDNKCEYYTNRKIEVIPYAFLLTDSYRVMGVILNKLGKPIKYSSLLLEDEEEILDLCKKLGTIKLDYKIIKKKDKSEFLTRNEKSIIKFISKDLLSDYKKRNINKLKYLYYEYFNKTSDNIDLIYEELSKELLKTINEKHYELYNLIKLSYGRKNVLN